MPLPLHRLKTVRGRFKAPVGQARAVAYAHAAASGSSRVSREASALTGWAVEFNTPLDLKLPARLVENWSITRQHQSPDASSWRSVVTALRNAAATQRAVTPRIRAVARALGLDGTEAAILQLAIDYACSSPCERLWDMLAEARSAPPFF